MADDIEKKLGIMLRVLRGEISQSDMAEMVETTQPQVSRYENHENVPDLNRLQQYANQLGYQVVIGLKSSPEEEFEVRWPIPNNLPEDCEEAVEVMRDVPPTEREDFFEAIHAAITDGKPLQTPEPNDTTYSQKLRQEAIQLLEQLMDIEDKRGVSDVMKAKRNLE